MEEANNITKIPILGIARSGSDRTCTDGKCNEVIGLEYKDGSYYPYAPTLYEKMNIEGAERVWIHKTSLQENWLKLQQGKMYWTKEETNDWQEIGEIGDFSFDTPIDFTGNLISLGNAIYFLFKNDRYIRFTREDLKLNLAFSVEQDKCYGIRTRYRWDVLSGMEKTQSKGFAETICGLYNKLDNKAIEENKLVGAAYICYAFRLYDGTYIYASSPILLKNFNYEKQYYKGIRSGNNTKDPVYDFEKNKYATPLFGTIYGENGGNPEFSTGDLGIESGIANLPSGALSSDSLYFDGLGTNDSDFRYGSSNLVGKYDYKLNANIPLNTYREHCSYVYKDIKYDWENRKEQQEIKDVKPIDEVFSILSNLGDFNTEEMSCISCIPNTSWGTEGLHDWCDIYAFRKASSITIKRNGYIDEKLKDFILSVDVFITRPILPVESGEQETIDNFQCVEHRKIKDKKAFLDELHTSQRAFYKIMEIPFEDCVYGGKLTFTDKDFVNTAFKNLTSKDTLVSYSNHTMLYNISYNFNQKIHIADFKYNLYKPNYYQLTDKNNTYTGSKSVYINAKLLIDGKEYTTQTTGYFGMSTHLHSTIYYPDTRAKSVTIYISKEGEYYYYKEFSLKSSDIIDYAYYEDEDGLSVTRDFETWNTINVNDFRNKYNDVVENSINNIMRVSNVGNPIVFPYTYSYQIGNGDIIGMSSNSVALSQGQFGEHKLFIFTTDGIWAMKTDTTGKGFYLDQDPVSREVCNNRNSICQIDGGVVFSSEKGLMIISGSNATLLSKELNGKPLSIDNRVYNTSVNNQNLVLLKGNHSNVDFREYLSQGGTFVTFLYKKNKLIIYNNNYSYCYLFDIETKVTTKLAYTFTYSISDYPNDKLVSGIFIYEFPIESNDEYIDTLLQTRPIKVGSHDFKSCYRTVVRGEFGTQKKKDTSISYLNIDNYKPEESLVEIKDKELTNVDILGETPVEVEIENNAFTSILIPPVIDININTYKTGDYVNGELIVIGDGIENQFKPQVNFTSISLETDVDRGKYYVRFKFKRNPSFNILVTSFWVDLKVSDGSVVNYKVEGNFKCDNNTIHSAEINNPDNYTFEGVSYAGHPNVSITSFSFYTAFTYRITYPVFERREAGLAVREETKVVVVRPKGYSNVDTSEINYSSLVMTNINANNSGSIKCEMYNNAISGVGAVNVVKDYNGNGENDSDDLIEWIIRFINNTEQAFCYDAKTYMLNQVYEIIYFNNSNVERKYIYPSKHFSIGSDLSFYDLYNIYGDTENPFQKEVITNINDYYRIKFKNILTEINYKDNNVGLVNLDLYASYRVTDKEGNTFELSPMLHLVDELSKSPNGLGIDLILYRGFDYEQIIAMRNKGLYVKDTDVVVNYTYDLWIYNSSQHMQNVNDVLKYKTDLLTIFSLLTLESGYYQVNYREESYKIYYNNPDNQSIVVSEFLENIKDEVYDEYIPIQSDTIIDDMIGNVTVNDEVSGYNFSFFSNYKDGKATYSQLITDYSNGLLEPIRDVDIDKLLRLDNGSYLEVIYNNKLHYVIYSGSNVISVGNFIKSLDTYNKFDINNIRQYKHIGLYIYGSIDCVKWGFLGGIERAGENLSDVLTKIERISVKYIRLVFVGNISSDSHIDAIEIQVSKKYNNKIR